MLVHLLHHVGIPLKGCVVLFENGPVFFEVFRRGERVEDRIEEDHFLGKSRRNPPRLEMGEKSPPDHDALRGGDLTGVIQKAARIGSHEQFLIPLLLRLVHVPQTLPGARSLIVSEIGHRHSRFQHEKLLLDRRIALGENLLNLPSSLDPGPKPFHRTRSLTHDQNSPLGVENQESRKSRPPLLSKQLGVGHTLDMAGDVQKEDRVLRNLRERLL